jgi:uncharacterized protein (DUF2336 family)
MDDGAITRQRRLSAGEILRRARQSAQATRRGYASLAECLFVGRDSELVLSDRQRAILSQLLRQVVGDIDSAVRGAFVARLDEGSGASRGAWPTVAADSGTLTYTIMLEKGLLRDTDLIEAAAHRLYQHQLERALRSPHRDRWGDGTEIERPARFLDLPIVENSLLERRISAYIVDRSRRIDTYGNPVLLPGDIGADLLGRLYWRVAAVLRGLLIEDSPGDPQRVDALIEPATVDAIRSAVASASAPTCAVDAAASLDAAGLLTGDVVLRLLSAGEIPLFEAAFARLAGLRPVLLRRLIYESGGGSIAVLARALGMTDAMASSLYTMTRAARAGLDPDAAGPDGGVMKVFEALAREDAERVRAYWARMTSFTHALWETDSGRIAHAAATPYR